MAVCKESNPGRTGCRNVGLGLHKKKAQWVECLLSMRRALGLCPQQRVKADVAGTCNPSIQEDDQKFKAIVCYIQFETSLGYMKPCLF